MIVSYCVCHVCGRRGLLVDKLSELRCPSTGVALAVCFSCESVELRDPPRPLDQEVEARLAKAPAVRDRLSPEDRASLEDGWQNGVLAGVPSYPDGGLTTMSIPEVAGAPTAVQSPGAGTVVTRYTYDPEASCTYCTDHVAHTMDMCNRIYDVHVDGNTCPCNPEDPAHGQLHLPSCSRLWGNPREHGVPDPAAQDSAAFGHSVRPLLPGEPVGREPEERGSPPEVPKPR